MTWLALPLAAIPGLALWNMGRNRSVPEMQTKQEPASTTKVAAISKKAKAIAATADYYVKDFPLLALADGLEVFIGRFKGNERAGIKGDSVHDELPYRVWVNTETGSGYVTGPGW
jgi:hypothetical protein